jgi:D-arabinose 1-dehydrogenase-like Zn-dependent alcohol dehydrogenase
MPVPVRELHLSLDVNDAYDKVEMGDVRFRYVIDMASLEAPE